MPFSFKFSEKAITTRVQKVHRLRQGKPFHERTDQYSIRSFTDYAQDYHRHYKPRYPVLGSTQEAQTEHEYWRIVAGEEDPKLQEKTKTTIEYAADLPVHQHGSGFPLFSSPRSSDAHFDYASSLFNLNNVYKSEGSLLRMCDRNG